MPKSRQDRKIEFEMELYKQASFFKMQGLTTVNAEGKVVGEVAQKVMDETLVNVPPLPNSLIESRQRPVGEKWTKRKVERPEYKI